MSSFVLFVPRAVIMPCQMHKACHGLRVRAQSFRAVIMPCQMHKACHGLRVRAQSFRDEGRSRNLVDANMKVLKERMEEIRVKERLERSCRRDEGWNYAPGNYCYKSKKQAENLSQYFQVLGSAAEISGLTILTATALLCLVSLIAHFHL